MIKMLVLFSLLLNSAWSQTTIPFLRDVPRIAEYAFVSSSAQDSDHFRTSFSGDLNDNLYFKGYTIQNMGPNDIIPTEPTSIDFPSREFFFVTDDNAKRDTYLWITDYVGSGATADYFETVMVFLPRVSQQSMQEVGDEIHANLATGEEVVFFKKYKTLLRGVLSEGALDFNPDRTKRSHAQISYFGKGIIIRSDTKGSDPRLARRVKIIKNNLPTCELPGSLFWTQVDFPKFKFVNDEDALKLIGQKCGPQYAAIDE